MPHDLRPFVVAYNDFAIAASDDAYQIGQYRLNRDKQKLSLTIGFVLIGANASDFQTKEAALAPLKVPNASLVIQQARELELNDLVGDGTTTVTSATGGFLAAHVGDWLVIRTIGARRITAVNSSTSATVHATVATGTYRAMKPARLFRGTNADRTFMLGEGTYEKVSGSAANTELSGMYSVSISGMLANVNSGLVKLDVTLDHDANRRRTFNISGEFAATAALSAKAIHDAQVDALVTLNLAPFGGSSTYDRVSQQQAWSPEDLTVGPLAAKTYAFRQTWKERLLVADRALIDESLVVTMQHGSTAHGLGMTGAVYATVSYSANVDRGVRGRSGLRTLYSSVVRNRISDAIMTFTQNGRGQQCIESESATFDQSDNKISSSWTVLLLGSSSTVLAYSAPQNYGNDPGNNAVPLWDGKAHTYAIWNGKPSRTRTNTQTVRSLAPVEFDSEGAFVSPDKNPFRVGGGLLGGRGGLGLGDAGDLGRIRIRWPRNAGGGGAGGGGGGIWMQKGPETINESIEIKGESVFGAFAKARIFNSTLTRLELWVLEGEPINPKLAIISPAALAPGVN